MQVQVRDYRIADKTQLEQVVSAAFPHDQDLRDHAYFGEARTTPTLVKTLVAVADEPVGFASFYQNTLHYHPHDFHVSLVVAPEFRQRGVGRKLHQALLDALPCSLARLRTLAPEQSRCGVFLEALKYQPLLRCFTPKLAVKAVDARDYKHVSRALEMSGYHVKSLADLELERDELVKLCLESYSDTHAHNPPTPSRDLWADIFLGEGCVDKAFFVAVKDESPVGFSSLRPGEREGERESMWDGVARSERALAFPLRLALKLKEIEYAKKHGVSTLNWEVDSVDLVGMQLMEALPFTVPPAHQVWVREVYANA